MTTYGDDGALYLQQTESMDGLVITFNGSDPEYLPVIRITMEFSHEASDDIVDYISKSLDRMNREISEMLRGYSSRLFRGHICNC